MRLNSAVRLTPASRIPRIPRATPAQAFRARLLSSQTSRRLVQMSTAPDPTSEWWTTSEVAAYLGLNVATVSAYRARGQMPKPDMTLGRTHVWHPGTIITWHEGRKRAGVGGRPKLSLG
jgi:predicted DNA-binding transcriptional regulator AlpA